jgi:hypothetical protein
MHLAMKGFKTVSPADKNKILGAIRAKDLAGLKEMCNGLTKPHYGESRKVYLDRVQLAALIKKYPKLSDETGHSRDQALKSFDLAEKQCETMNGGLEDVDLDKNTKLVLYKAQGIIKGVLGRFDMAKAMKKCKFGPGMSLLTDQTSEFGKLRANQYSCSNEFVARLTKMVSLEKPEFCGQPTVVPYNRVTVVPKTAWTDRTIAIEPLMNMFFQLGVGEYMSQRIRLRTKIDIRDQGPNQRAARDAIRNDSATVDLSAASDSLSFRLVYRLLAKVPDWRHYLSMLRSENYLDPRDEVVKVYEKWSSMGNGYTFPLETLLFYGLAQATVNVMKYNADVIVYGDDIILPSACYNQLCRIFEALGLKVNQEKSFSRGSFFESCGCDYLDGVDVRPYFLKAVPTKTTQVYHLVNSLKACEQNFFDAQQYLIELLHKEETFYGPPASLLDARPDRYIEVPNPNAWTTRWNKKLQRTEIKGIVYKARNFRNYIERGSFSDNPVLDLELMLMLHLKSLERHTYGFLGKNRFALLRKADSLKEVFGEAIDLDAYEVTRRDYCKAVKVWMRLE